MSLYGVYTISYFYGETTLESIIVFPNLKAAQLAIDKTLGSNNFMVDPTDEDTWIYDWQDIKWNPPNEVGTLYADYLDTDLQDNGGYGKACTIIQLTQGVEIKVWSD